jgi:hypothetical protein
MHVLYSEMFRISQELSGNSLNFNLFRIYKDKKTVKVQIKAQDSDTYGD